MDNSRIVGIVNHRRFYSLSGNPMSYYFKTRYERKKYIKDAERFLDECFALRKDSIRIISNH